MKTREILSRELDGRITIQHDDGVHMVPLAGTAPITVDGKDYTPQQVMWFLDNDVWEDKIVDTCGKKGCTLHMRLDIPAVTEDDLLKLVEKNSVSLADLYRRGRQKGLLGARSGY
jgi:hypothetical protein